MSDETPGVFVPVPLPDEQVFRYRAADDVLELLYRNPHTEFTVTDLREITGHGGKSVANAIEILGGLGLVRKRRDGRHSLIRIDQGRLRKPNDSLFEIPQVEFRKPVREFLNRVEEDQGDNLVGVVLFGSVARGRADRTSDVDIQVIVRDHLVAARRDLQAIRQDVENERFDGHRYEIQLLVESVESARNHGEELRELFSEGITLYSTSELEDLREVILGGE